ncbi:AAA family ATPase [Nostoc sp. PCC 9305]|uniref:AAA family ATPase n=1 Tax=Nostoc sp. PCC 9305 TaxID=296636 RepID=UPI0039C69DAD
MVRILAIVGMPGSGKSVVASYLKDNGFPIIRFGEIIICEVEKRGLPITPQNEQIVREEIRRKQGMDVCAQIALPLIKAKLLDHQLVIIDGLYSFSEYKTLKEEFNEELLVIATFTPKSLRYERLALRQERPLTLKEAERRDFMEIEKIEKGGPIAMADLTIVNDESQYQLQRKLDKVLAETFQEISQVAYTS